MAINLKVEFAPLCKDEQGDIRVGESRVLLDMVVHAFEDGATPEAIVQMYPMLNLPDVYGAICYYLRHRAQVEDYLCEREQRGEDLRQRFEDAQPDVKAIRQRLLQRRSESGKGDASSSDR